LACGCRSLRGSLASREGQQEYLHWPAPSLLPSFEQPSEVEPNCRSDDGVRVCDEVRLPASCFPLESVLQPLSTSTASSSELRWEPEDFRDSWLEQESRSAGRLEFSLPRCRDRDSRPGLRAVGRPPRAPRCSELAAEELAWKGGGGGVGREEESSSLLPFSERGWLEESLTEWKLTLLVVQAGHQSTTSGRDFPSRGNVHLSPQSLSDLPLEKDLGSPQPVSLSDLPRGRVLRSTVHCSPPLSLCLPLGRVLRSLFVLYPNSGSELWFSEAEWLAVCGPEPELGVGQPDTRDGVAEPVPAANSISRRSRSRDCSLLLAWSVGAGERDLSSLVAALLGPRECAFQYPHAIPLYSSIPAFVAGGELWPP